MANNLRYRIKLEYVINDCWWYLVQRECRWWGWKTLSKHATENQAISALKKWKGLIVYEE